MTELAFVMVRDKTGKSSVINLWHVQRILQQDPNTWEVRLGSGEMVVLDSKEIQKLFQRMPGVTNEQK